MTNQENPREGDRIAKLLARAGVASRREVERMIAEGRIRIGEEVVTTPATLLTSLKGVSVDGKPVKAPDPARLFAFHKPAGLITAEHDPAGRPTIYNALRNALPENAGRVMPVGRLDFNTEGLLLLTNDGGLKRAMELPSSGIPRTYRARTFGDVTQEQLEALIEGIEIDGVRYGQINANLERSTGRNRWIEVTITEGKNREVRRVLEHLGLEVSRLIRTAYGPFELLDLPRGAAVEIRPQDLERFMHGLKLGTAPRAPQDHARNRVLRGRPHESSPSRSPAPAWRTRRTEATGRARAAWRIRTGCRPVPCRGRARGPRRPRSRPTGGTASAPRSGRRPPTAPAAR